MNFIELLEATPNVSVTITAKELFDAFRTWANETEKPKEEEVVTFTIDEAAKKLRVNRTTLWRWVRDGYIKQIEAGGKRFIAKSEIDRILNK